MEFTIKKSESIKNLAAKMLQVQKAGVDVTKNSTNPFFKVRYADLGEHIEAILPLCNDAGLWVSQLPSTTSLCTIVVDSESGEWIEGYYPIIVATKTPQEIASQITYARRYSLGSIFNANAIDDDGNAVSGKVVEKAPTKPWINKASVTDVNFTSAKAMIEKGEIKNEADLLAKFMISPSVPKLKETILALIK